MQELIKALSGSAALSGLLVIVLFMGSFGVAWARLYREYQEWKDRLTEMKDTDLANFRKENEELKVKMKSLVDRAAKLENRTVEQGAILYGKIVYIRRLEKGYRERGQELPPRDGPDEE